jgi:dolichol-phosphate mannosyltransferase
VAELVARLHAALPDVAAELIFVDDSDDGTEKALAAVARRSARPIRTIHRPLDRRGNGLAGAVVEGIRDARGTWVCVMDADLQHPPEVVEQLMSRAKEGDANVVVASRRCEGGGTSGGAFSGLRSFLSRGSTASARMLFPTRLRGVTDPMSGFFLVRREALELDRLRPRGFKILLEILARTRGLKIAEVPFEFAERHAGESKASVRQAVAYLRQLADLRLGSFGRLSRFAVVGLSGIPVNMLLIFLLTDAAGVYYVASAILATQGSTLWNFALTEKFVFNDRTRRAGRVARMAKFLAVNNVALGLRVPMLLLLTSLLSVNYLVSNLVTLFALTAIRFVVSDGWIWRTQAAKAVTHAYDIHGIATVVSAVALPELKAFEVEHEIRNPTIRVRIGKLSAKQSDLVASLAFFARHTRYDEGLGRLGFGVEIGVGKSVEILASPLLRWSPHVLYTNVVEPVLRWTVVKKGYALVHGACIAKDGDAYLITARTDTGKTTTVLRALDRYSGLEFLSDDLTLVGPDGRVLAYPKPLTVSNHTVGAVKTPLLSWRERLMLVYQSRVHSRSGRRFAFLLATRRIPTATINAVVQLLIPPPKYHVERLVPGVEKVSESRLAGMVVIQRGSNETTELTPKEAFDVLMSNCEDAFGFPPYASIAPFLHGTNGSDLRHAERTIVAEALSELPATLLSSSRMDWSDRLARILGHPVVREHSEQAVPATSEPVPVAPAALPGMSEA